MKECIANNRNIALVHCDSADFVAFTFGRRVSKPSHKNLAGSHFTFQKKKRAKLPFYILETCLLFKSNCDPIRGHGIQSYETRGR